MVTEEFSPRHWNIRDHPYGWMTLRFYPKSGVYWNRHALKWEETE